MNTSDQNSEGQTVLRNGSVEESYPLSPLQHGMLFHSLYEQVSGVDIEQIVCTVTEELDCDKLRQAWQRVVSRHAILRTAFAWEGLPEPVQEIHRNVQFPFEEHDWRELSTEEQQTRLHDHLRDDRRAGFDLTQAPLLRVAVFRTATAGFWLLWTFHHAILDGRSYRLVIREVFEVYEALLQGRDPDLKQSRPYRDYIDWSLSRDLSRAESFCREQLGDFTRPTPLTVDRQAAKDQDSETGHAQFEIKLSASVTSRLSELALANELTLNTVVQCAWAILLSLYSSEEDVVFGTTRACRHSDLEGLESMLGLFINTIPMRVRVDRSHSVMDLLRTIRRQHLALREFENTPLVKIQEWSGVGSGSPLFESIIVFDRDELNTDMQSLGGKWKNRSFRAIEQTNYPLTLFAYGESEMLLRLVYDESRFDASTITRLANHLEKLSATIADKPEQLVSEMSLLTDVERSQMLNEWNDTSADFNRDACVHQLFEAQVARTPEAVALAFEDLELTYAEVNQKANQLAARLIGLGVGPDSLVGICVRRSPEMVLGLLAILKAGGAYVPLDPEYPTQRIEFMIEDADISVLLADRVMAGRFSEAGVCLVNLDDFWDVARDDNKDDIGGSVTSRSLAYVIYTSGSTGVPKGVMVEHRNVVNFFKAIDDHLGVEPGVWLALTSISFDISVMELLWTLTRGFKVVIQGGSSVDTYSTNGAAFERPIDFSLFYFASDHGEHNVDKYRLLLEGARFADSHDFAAIWTPERHFHSFGGLYPNPAVTSAAIAAITQNVRIRAGSVVLPLHDPVRVAEEWAVVDNISKGRVDIAFASGWHASDFALSPGSYADRKETMLRGIDTVRSLWRGESVTRTSGDNSEVQIRIYPKPLQENIPIWLTAAGSPETFRAAGASGANVLTNLLGQSVEELAEKIKTYRAARKNSDQSSSAGTVTLMLHTFVSDDLEFVKEKVRGPFTQYLKTSVDLIKNAPWAYPAFQRESRVTAKSLNETLGCETGNGSDLELLAEHAFERYFQTSGLFGTPESCLDFVNRLKEIGVDEIACLVDFNVDADSVLAGLEHLNELRKLSNISKDDYSIPAQIARHGVTHVQCTPSTARLMAADSRTLSSLSSLQHLVLGGEALPENLVREIAVATDATIHNMYGPTETTIWSTAFTFKGNESTIPIGRPLANTQVYILNSELQPVPIGVPGELYIGGDGVTRGYLKQPALTKERFITSPFNEEEPVRLYRTGDLALYLPDGSIEFLGRVDHQVKVRGYRVELGEIQALLDDHPDVRQSVVHAREDASDGKSLVAYVVRHDQNRETEQLKRVADWHSVWEGTYAKSGNSLQSRDNFSGWNSSYNGEPIPEGEMREWLDGTVSKILALNPSRVLEIGCGTGLVLFRIAPHCTAYCATDISKAALDQVRQTIDDLESAFPQLTLFERSADDFTDLSNERFDTIVLNSIVQYFPDSNYLLRVLRGAIELVKPGGSVFIGDVRSLQLLEAFHASVALHHASDTESCADLLQRLKEAQAREQELAFAPEFFEHLKKTLSGISGVEISLKKGRHLNEMTKFRYDVRLKVGPEESKPIRPDWSRWHERPVTVEDTRTLLSNGGDDVIAIAGIPNKRLQSEFDSLELLKSTNPPPTIAELRDSLSINEPRGLDPMEIWELATEFQRPVVVRRSSMGADRFDVVFGRRDESENDLMLYLPAEPEENGVIEFTNHPGQNSAAELSAELRAYLEGKLPHYMVPSAIVMLDAIPLTPNGKLDRNALPAPEVGRLVNALVDAPPADELEEVVAELWSELLGIKEVGRDQSFFHVGGHSLVATQLVSRLRSMFQVDLSLRDAFDFPTVAGIAGCMVRRESQPGQSQKIARIIKHLNEMPVPDLIGTTISDGRTK
ncbi:MAG: MupA/Atu3671 family FMN-dependent luciferase-like monooxygenase [Pyrinomonadaceae bacterium]